MENKVLKLLFEIRKRPGMYLGEVSLERLRIYIAGYIYAMHQEGIDCGENVYYDFNKWIHDKYNIKKTISWDRYLPNIACNSNDAFKLFYEELDLYINTQQVK